MHAKNDNLENPDTDKETKASPGMRKCKECNSTISGNIIVCGHCGAYQNWKRYIHWIKAVLLSTAAIITAVTVIVALPINWRSEELESLEETEFLEEPRSLEETESLSVNVSNLSLVATLDSSRKESSDNNFIFFDAPLTGTLTATVENESGKDGVINYLGVLIVSDNYKQRVSFIDRRKEPPIVISNSIRSFQINSLEIIHDPDFPDHNLSLSQIDEAELYLIMSSRMSGSEEVFTQTPIDRDKLDVSIPTIASIFAEFDINSEEELVLTIENRGSTDVDKLTIMWGYIPYWIENFDNNEDESNPPPGLTPPPERSGIRDVQFHLDIDQSIGARSRFSFVLGPIAKQREELASVLQAWGRTKLRVQIYYAPYPGAETKSFTNDQQDLTDSLSKRLMLREE